MTGLQVTDEYTRRGIDVVILENEKLRVELMPGKGFDITEILDKRTETNVLFEAPHEWRAPGDNTAPRPDPSFAFLDHYPGGWQDVLPNAGGPATVAGAPLGQHGEAAVVPWDTTIYEKGDCVEVVGTVSLTRYPLDIRRTVLLTDGSQTVQVDETVTNAGEVPIEYSWLQHIAFGPPLVSPGARLNVPCDRVLVDPDHDDPNARFEPGEEFDWPYAQDGAGTSVDLREFPAKSERIHDLVALADLSGGRYTITNQRLDLEVTVRFPESLFEYVWYWQAFGGFEGSPFFGRTYTAGLEPATSIPNAGLEAAIENGTAEGLNAGETVSASVRLETSSPSTSEK